MFSDSPPESNSMESETTITDLRTASFAVYVNEAKDSFTKKLSEPDQLPSSGIIPDEDSLVIPVHPGKIVSKDAEIGVFGAEKYFNMSIDDKESISTTPRLMDDYARKLGFKQADHVDPCYGGTKVRSGTPSISSESSWGSQPAFLRSFQRGLSHGRQSSRASDHRGFLAGLSCNKSCADWKWIHVSERGAQREEVAAQSNGTVPLGGSERKLPSQSQTHSHPWIASQSRDKFQSSSFEGSRSGSKRIEPFAFPVLHSNAPKELLLNRPFKIGILPKGVEEPRISLEVFSSKPRKRADNVVEMNLERKLSMLTWDAIPRAQVLKSPSRMDEDMGSEVSSELFEIENISGTGTIPPSMCYEPSEASIEWSVMTASAADFSVLSEYDEKEVIPGTNHILTDNKRPDFIRSLDHKEVHRSRTSGLLGCKSHKAVQIAETTHKMGEQPRTPRSLLRLESAVP